MSNPISISRSCQNCFDPVLVFASRCQTLFAFVQSAKTHLRSVLSLAHLSAFSAAQETQIEFAFYFFTQVSRCQTPSAFPEAAKMQLETPPFLVITTQCQTLYPMSNPICICTLC